MPATNRSESFAVVIAAAQGERSRGARLIIFAVAITFSIQIGFSIAGAVDFEVDLSSGVVGWAAANEYPIQQETFFWLISAFVVAAAFLATWGLWLAAGWVLARAGQGEPTRELNGAALSLLWFLILWRGFADVATLAFGDLLVPAALAVVTLAAVFSRFRAGGGGEAKGPGAVAAPPRNESGPSDPRRGGDDEAKASPSARRRRRCVARGVIVWLVVPLALVVTHHNLISPNRVDLFHDGESLYPMWEVLHGAVPYRDVYLQHGLFHNAWFPALGSVLTGETYATARVTRGLVLPLGAVAMYLFGMAVFRGRALPAFLFVIFFSTGISDRYLFTYLALALALAAMKGPVHFSLLRPPPDRPGPDERRRRMREGSTLLASGFAAMMAFWHTLDAGVFAIGAIGLFLLIVGLLQPGIAPRRRLVPFLAFTVGVAAGFWMIGVYFHAHGALDDLIRNVHLQGAFHLDIWGRRFPSVYELLAPLNERGWIGGLPSVIGAAHLKFYWPPLTLLAAVAVLVHRWLGRSLWSSRASVSALMITIAGLAFFRGAIGRSDAGHLANGAVMAPVLLLLVLDLWGTRTWESIRTGARRSSALVPPVAQLVIAVSLFIGFGLVMDRDFRTLGRFSRGVRSAWAGPVASAGEATVLPKQGSTTLGEHDTERVRDIAELVEYIKANSDPGDTVYDFSNRAALLFLADRRSPTRYFMAVYASPPALQREVIASLEEKRPALVVFKGNTWSDHFDGVRTKKRLPLIAEYLKENYGRRETIGGTIVLRRKDPSGAAAR